VSLSHPGHLPHCTGRLNFPWAAGRLPRRPAPNSCSEEKPTPPPPTHPHHTVASNHAAPPSRQPAGQCAGPTHLPLLSLTDSSPFKSILSPRLHHPRHPAFDAPPNLIPRPCIPQPEPSPCTPLCNTKPACARTLASGYTRPCEHQRNCSEQTAITATQTPTPPLGSLLQKQATSGRPRDPFSCSLPQCPDHLSPLAPRSSLPHGP
jgi:hypothetical protein